MEEPQGGFWKSKIRKQKRLLKKQNRNSSDKKLNLNNFIFKIHELSTRESTLQTNGDLKININWLFINTISPTLGQSYMSNMPGDYLSSKELRHPITSRSTENEQLLNEK